ncbi:MAG: hypothetical protein ACAH59_13230 [Pseudobdellovibrionaceae bacterium]
MRTVLPTEQVVTTPSNGSQEGRAFSSQVSYHEMDEVPVQETDVLEQLQANMRQLADLQARMKFMMKEIRYLMKV